MADWPAGGFDRRRVERLLRTRVAAVVARAADEIEIGGRIGNHLLQLFNPAITGILVDRALEEIDDAVAEGRLS